LTNTSPHVAIVVPSGCPLRLWPLRFACMAGGGLA